MPKTTPPLWTNDTKYERAVLMPKVLERLANRISYSDDGCHIWTGAKSSAGYGVLSAFYLTVYAHRLSYWVHRGPIAPGMTVDHLCHVRACINPAHMEIVTPSENSKRVPKAEQTHCNRGHALEEANIRVDKNGYPHRYCRACNIERAAEWRSARVA